MMADHLDDILKCQICLEDFEETGDHVPRLLPCSHTLCEKCLKQLVRTFVHGKSVVCPECRKKHAMVDVKTFPQNRYIMVNLKEKQRDRETVKCEEHGGKELTLYCRRNECQKAICSKCLTASHRAHDVVDIEEKQKEILLAKTTLKMKIKRKAIAGVKEEIRDFQVACSKELQSHQDKLVNQIRERFEVLKKNLDDHASLMVKDIDKDMTSIDQYLEVLNGIKINMTHGIASQEDVRNGLEVIKSIAESSEAHVSGTKGYEVLRYCATGTLKEDIEKLCGRLTKDVVKLNHTGSQLKFLVLI